MKVIELKEFSLDGLTLTERPQPKLGAGEVLVRIHAASLNYRDVLTAKGLYPPAAIRDKRRASLTEAARRMRSTT